MVTQYEANQVLGTGSIRDPVTASAEGAAPNTARIRGLGKSNKWRAGLWKMILWSLIFDSMIDDSLGTLL